MTEAKTDGPLSFADAREVILREIYAHDVRVSGEYFQLFKDDVAQFADSIATSVAAWKSLDHGGSAEERAYVTGLVSGATSLLVGSMSLFMNGNIVAAGNLMRQVTETIAIALLCSDRELPVLKAFMRGKYRSANAMRDLKLHARRLHLKGDAVSAIDKARTFYHHYSHPTLLTLGAQISYAGEGSYVGACFDPGKVDVYRHEIDGRVGLARVFLSFVKAVQANVHSWRTQPNGSK